MKWIACKERLPEPDETVLVWYVDEVTSTNSYGLAAIDEVALEQGEYPWYGFEKLKELLVDTSPEVSHWMPLPPPPNQGDNRGPV